MDYKSLCARLLEICREYKRRADNIEAEKQIAALLDNNNRLRKTLRHTSQELERLRSIIDAAIK